MGVKSRYDRSYLRVELKQVFEDFGELLGERLANGINTTEDSVRYLLFYSLTVLGGIDPNGVVLEYPYSVLERAKLDTLVLPRGADKGIAFEFKYHRKNESGKPKPRSMQAGKVFADLWRLHMFNAVKADKYFVYVTDDEMNKYYSNRSNGVHDFYNLNVGRELVIDQSYISGKSKTFRENAGKYTDAITVAKTYEQNGEDYWLKIYKII